MLERPPVPRCSNVTGRDELSRVKTWGAKGEGGEGVREPRRGDRG